jgi:hypothetical protein
MSKPLKHRSKTAIAKMPIVDLLVSDLEEEGEFGND